MNEKEMQLMLDQQARMLKGIRAELDAIRTIVIGLLQGLSDDPTDSARIAAHIALAVEGDNAVSLMSPTTDDMLELRSRWLQTLLPPKWKP